MSLGDFDASAVIYGKFTTYRPSTGAPFTLAGTPALSVYKDNSVTQSTSGVTLTADFDSVTGLHHFAIDTSADGTFYAAGSFFDVVITAGTVDSISAVGTVVGRFSIRKTSALKPTTSGRTLVVDASGLADANMVKVAGTTQTAGDLAVLIDGIGTAGGAAINIDAAGDNFAGGISGVTSGTTKVGTQTGTYLNASFENLIYHVMTHTGNAIDIVYQYLLGGGTTPVGVRWIGYLTSANDTVKVSAWNHVGGSWEEIGSIAGTAGTSNSTYNLTLYPRHSGTSTAELGKVYIRLHCTAQTSPVLNTDQLVVSYAVTSRTVGYSEGAVWVDTVNGVAGTELFVNGVADNPSSTFASAITIANSLNLHKFAVTNGSSITLAASANNYTFQGHEWELALNGQNIASSMVVDATVSGTSTGDDAEFETCIIDTATLSQFTMWECLLKGTLTIGGTGDCTLIDCASGIAGSGSPIIDMGAAVGATNLSLRRWSGGLTLNNLAAGDVVSVDVVSGGTITLNGADATVNVRGMCTVVNNLTGSPTVGTGSVLNQTLLATPTNITAGTITTAINLTTNNDKTGYRLSLAGVGDILTTALTESYATDGSAMTLSQALYQLWSLAAEKSIATTTLTAKKLDGTTTSMTFTLNDATSPTSITRAT